MIISLALPTRNAEWCLPHSFKSILEQTTPPDEILICIGPSTDRTEELVLEFQKKSKVPVRVFYDREGIGTGYAINLITENAKGDLVLWIDSDGIKPHSWVKRISNYFEKDKDLIYLRERGKEIDSANISKFHTEDYTYTPHITYDNEGKIITAAGLMAFRRDQVLKLDNFDPLFSRGQDLDMTIKLFSSDYKGGECTSQGYHFGVYGLNNIKKCFKHGTFFKLLYKYGWRYCFVYPQHFAGVLLRTTFLLSTIFLLISLFYGYTQVSLIFGGLILLTQIGIALGLYISFGRLNINQFVIQILDSIGEFYQLWCLMRIKNKPPMGYGKKYIMR